ncbi:putative RNA dependent RNA polymerase [Fusarium sambucinum victorivirus 1]|nr:putative RNA dependent RNA polymerase [Fusarium sambucinum victorivirus 1]
MAGSAAAPSLSDIFSRAEGRRVEFGSLGSVLFGILKSAAPHLGFLSGLTFAQQLATVELRAFQLTGLHPLLPAAISLLACEFPIQLTKESGLASLLLRSAYGLDQATLRPGVPTEYSTLAGAPLSYAQLVKKITISKEFRAAAYPYKAHPGAVSKPNVHLGGLARALTTIVGSTEAGRWFALIPIGTPRDVVCSHILYSFALRPQLQVFAPVVSAIAITRPKDAKGLSNALKALGLNATALGANLTEAQTLQGRMVGAIDWDQELAKRLDPEVVRKGAVKMSAEDLRPHVEAILDIELPQGFTLPALDDFWSARWAWCVNGAHTAAASEMLGIPGDAFPGFARTYRRMASEFVAEEPISQWDGLTRVSKSDKLEHGKTRAIFACDTRSYFAWSWPLNAIQKAWKNRRVLLDPGRGGMSYIGSRINRAAQAAGVNLMLDFDDFNSHHTTEIMQMVTRSALARSDAPGWLVDVLVKSLDSEYIEVDGVLRHVAGTLMSGHRGTTFFNSVLNAAYFRMAAGGDMFNRILSLHTGDDVYARVATFHDVAAILTAMPVLGCRLNPTKQSIGHRHAEFLRCAFAPERAWGYVARAIATCASGSWTNDQALGPRELFQTNLSNTRAIINRSGNENFPRLLAPAFHLPRGTGIREAIGLLAGGRAALDNSPVYNTPAPFPRYRLKIADPLTSPMDLKDLPNHATRQYLSSHLSPVELEALTITRTDPQPLLTASSYSKGQVEDKTAPPVVKMVSAGVYSPRSPGLAAAAYVAERVVGALNVFPIVQLLRDTLSLREVVHLLSFLGVPPGPDPRRTAFGSEAHPVLVTGTLPFSDASSIARVTGYDHIYVTYPIGM